MLSLDFIRIPNIPHVNPQILRTTALAAIIHSQAAENLDYNLYLLIESSDTEVFKKDPSKLREIVALLRDSFMTTFKQDPENVIHEFIRRIYCGNNGLDLMDAVRFVKFLKEFKDVAYKSLHEVIKDRGDDAYGDLVDSVIMAGDVVVQRICCGAYRKGDYERFVQDVKEGSGEKLAKIILEGENYIEMFTIEKIQEFFAGWVKHQIEDVR